ncbi:MAG: hypothetical protein ABIH99_02610 [Candidatus Micrarchaeota archaeon]
MNLDTNLAYEMSIVIAVGDAGVMRLRIRLVRSMAAIQMEIVAGKTEMEQFADLVGVKNVIHILTATNVVGGISTS